MILMGFERGDVEDLKPFLSEEVYQTFAEVVADRQDKGLVIEAEFIGIRELALHDATFDAATGEGDVSVRYVAELTSVVKDASGQVIEGSATAVKKQKDVWTFARKMGSSDPNWQLVATDE
jgi:predicted lipid-binding transport protein (Tim44 family)